MQAFKEACASGDFEDAQNLVKTYPSLNTFGYTEILRWARHNEHLSTMEKYRKIHEMEFKYACADGELELARKLLQAATPLLQKMASRCFRTACCNGHLDVAQWLFTLDPDMDISAEKEGAFRDACYQGHVHVAQWLLNIKPTIDIHAKKDYALRFARRHNHLPILELLDPIIQTRG